jgi:hypothetical protein
LIVKGALEEGEDFVFGEGVAEMISKEGFSVVAPMRRMVPCST